MTKNFRNIVFDKESTPPQNPNFDPPPLICLKLLNSGIPGFQELWDFGNYGKLRKLGISGLLGLLGVSGLSGFEEIGN